MDGNKYRIGSGRRRCVRSHTSNHHTLLDADLGPVSAFFSRAHSTPLLSERNAIKIIDE